MRGFTGIEVGADWSCVLVHTRSGREPVQVSAVYGLEPDEGADPRAWPGEHLRDVRRRVGFPRRARVVAWGLPQSPSATDGASQVWLAPLHEAGFLINDVMSPPEALAALARLRPALRGRDGTAWLAVNRRGVAIAIVLDGELEYSREFTWNYRVAATAKEELLQRYTLVAHIAPELRHGFDVVRQRRGRTVDAVVTCGDLPDLRSLTMPLIDELDIEVETLDALDGLEVPSALAERIGDRAPAVRLASAAGAGRREASARAVLGRRATEAAAVLLVGVLAWAVMRLVVRSGGDATVTDSPASTMTSGSSRPGAGSESPAAAAAPQTPSGPGNIEERTGAAATTGLQAPHTGTGGPVGVPMPPENRSLDRSTSVAPSPAAVAPTTPGTGVLREPPERPPAFEQPSSAERAPQPRAPLRAPLPVVNSIMVAPNRRLAVVDGAIVREGDAVGPRVLIRIEPDAVVLREPSGYEVRVSLRRRVGTVPGS
jgi:hypothetical protein